jgi:hypothetical protein
MDLRKYNEVIFSRIQVWFEKERARENRLIWRPDGASCHRSFETTNNLYRRNLSNINWPPYSLVLNLIEHV